MVKGLITPFEVDLNDLPKDVQVFLHKDEEGTVLHFTQGNIVAAVGVGSNHNRRLRPFWATVYSLDTRDGSVIDYRDAKPLIVVLREYYRKHDYDFAYAFAHNTDLRSLLYTNQIKVREEGVFTGASL